MKKKDIKKLAIMGITGGLLLGSQAANANQDQSQIDLDQVVSQRGSCGGRGGCGGGKPPKNGNSKNGNAMKNGGKVSANKHMSEDDLMKQLNPEMKKVYENMSPEGKALALELGNQECRGRNTCKGKNACQTKDNDCAGKGSCRGKGKCSFEDKNMAVKVAAKKMEEKRSRLHNQ